MPLIALLVPSHSARVPHPSQPHREGWDRIPLAILVIAALTILPLSLQAQAPSQTLQTLESQIRLHNVAEGPTGTITGHVYCADTNAPARFARVSLIRIPTADSFGGGPMETATTNTDGLFSVPVAPAGSYYIDVAAPGYISPLRAVDNAELFNVDPATRAHVMSLVPNVTINGNDSANIEVRLDRGAAITGTVFFDDGTPASNLQITASQKTASPIPNGRRNMGFRFNGFQSNRTDDQGRFRLAGLATGDYIVSASFMPDAVRVAPPQQVNAIQFRSGGTPLTIYAPRATTTSAAALVSVKAGSERSGVDITLPIHALHNITGTVSSATHSITGGQISLTGLDDPDFHNNTQINDDGSFQFNFIPEGRYTLDVRNATDGPPRTFNNRRQQQPPSDNFGPASTTVTLHTGDATGITITVPQLQTTTAQQWPQSRR